ncbi:MAG: DUF1616 domain-containing protein [Methanomassiliicoccales archaeon]
MRFDLGRSWDLTGIVTLSLLLIAVIWILPDSPARVVLGLPFILFFPGYALIAFLFPRKKDLGIIERVALSFGLSIAVTPLIGLGLNYTPFGIRLTPILASLTAFNLLFSLLAWWRRERVERPFLPIPPQRVRAMLVSSFQEGSRLDRALTVVLAISIVSSLIALGYVVAVPKQGEKFTEFYLLGPGGKASDYPTNLTAGEGANLTIGIANHEYQEMYYGVEIWLANTTFQDNGTTVEDMLFFDSFNVTLEHVDPDIEGNWTAQWEMNYSFSIDVQGEYGMWFLLYKDRPEFDGVRYRDYPGMGDRIIEAVQGDLMSLKLNMRIR